MRPEGRRYIQYGVFYSSMGSVCFFVFPNWFLCTNAANENTIFVLCYCGNPFKNFSVMPECVINVHHIYQLPECLSAVSLEIPLVVLSMPLVMIPKR